MTPRTLLLALLVFAAAPLRAQVVAPPPPSAEVPELPPLGADLEVSTPTVVLVKDAERALEGAGWKLENDGSLVRREGKSVGIIPKSYLEQGGVEWKDGRLKYKRSPASVDYALYARFLSGLQSFTLAAAVKPEAAGAALAGWGLPPTVVGRRLYEPNGKATYFGLMLHQLLASRPGTASTLGLERLEQVMNLLDEAYAQAFYLQAADISQGILERAKAILYMPPRAGETLLSSVMGGGARQDPATMIKGYKAAIEKDIQAAKDASDAARQKASEEALAVLNTLERQRVYAGNTLQEIPEPGRETPPSTPGGRMTKAIFGVGEGGEAEKKEEPPPYAPLATGLPGLLQVLDRVNGTPLTSEQQRDLIQTFPMGDLVWRTGVHHLWKKGLTGKGVSVAIIDEGVAEHPELDGSVKSRVNLTAQRGSATVGDHGTHVAATVLALAPGVSLNSYGVFPGGFGDGNRKLAESPQRAIVEAIHKAVADGNQIVNMSLGSGEGPSAEIARVVEEYARKGVIFVVSAGNARHYAGGVGSPSSAPSAITVGSTDWTGRMSDFSSYGERFDARTLQTVVKDIFLFPGGDITAALPEGMVSMPGGEKTPRYGSMSGTSMAAPGVSGVTALMVQEVANLPVKLNPVAAADRIKTALRLGSEPVALDRLPTNVPLDQPFLVLNPGRAAEALGKPEVTESVAGKEGR